MLLNQRIKVSNYFSICHHWKGTGKVVIFAEDMMVKLAHSKKLSEKYGMGELVRSLVIN